MMEWNSRLNFLNLWPWLASSLKPRGIRAEGAGWFTGGTERWGRGAQGEAGRPECCRSCGATTHVCPCGGSLSAGFLRSSEPGQSRGDPVPTHSPQGRGPSKEEDRAHILPEPRCAS